VPGAERRPRRRLGGRILALALLATLPVPAGAHATLVLGRFTSNPDPPAAASPAALTIHLEDPSGTPIEDAKVLADLQPAAEETGAPVTIRFNEVADPPGTYRSSFTPTKGGTYTITVRDQTYGQEEARAHLSLEVGGDPNGDIPFVLPPTATGPRSLGTWLVWLIGIPLAAGLLVTVLVMRGGPRGEGRSSPGRDDDGGAPTS